MKNLILLFMLHLAGVIYAQVVELPEINVLFRGYENKIELPHYDSLEFTCSGCEFKRDEFTVTVTPKQNVRVADLILLKNGDTVRRNFYRVSNLPEPELKWGGSMTGGKVNYFSKALKLETYIHLPINYSFDITSWKVGCEEHEFSGNGTILSDQVISFLRSFPTNKEVVLTVNATSSTNKTFTLSKKYLTDDVSLLWQNTPQFKGEFTFIDKNENNRSLFDINDPFSLVGLLRNNEIRSINFMSEVTASRLKEDNNELLLEVNEDHYDFIIPLVDEDPKSPDFGEPLIEELEDGTESYIYPNINSFYDLENITRIVVFYDTVENELTGEKYFGIDRLGFAKKYADGEKYDVVFTVDFKEISEMDGYKALVKLNASDKAILIDSTNFFDNLSINALNFIPTYVESINLGRVVDDYVIDFWKRLRFNKFDRYFHSRMPAMEERTFHSRYFEYPKPAAFSHIDHTLPFDFLSLNDVRSKFDCEVMDVETDWPIYNEYGEPLTRVLENGDIEEIKNVDSNIVWVNFKPSSVYVMFDFNYDLPWNAGQNTILPETIFFTTDSLQLKNEVCLFHYRFDDIEQRNLLVSYFDGEGIFRDLPNYGDYENLPWRLKLKEEIEREERLKTTNKKDLKRIRSEFNLDSISDLPFNLMGITK